MAAISAAPLAFRAAHARGSARSLRRTPANRSCPRATARSAPAVRAAASGKPAGLGSTLTNWLLKEEQAGRMDGDMAILLSSVSVANKRIAAMVQREYYTGVNLSERANEIFCEVLGASGRTGVIASGDAADAAPIAVEESFAGDYVVVFDPLDGVSNLDAAVTSGSIFGVYEAAESCVPDFDADDEGAVAAKCVASACRPGSNLIAAGYCMYSSSTILVLTLGDGVHGFTFDPSVGEFIMSHERIRVPERGKIYSFNEGNYDTWDEDVRAYVDALKQGGPDQSGKPYSARYIGSLVGDFHRTMLYGGICGQPATDANPEGRLRLLTECAPMAFIAEQCGGTASTGRGRLLDQTPTEVHARTPFYVGSKKEVEYLESMLSGEAPARTGSTKKTAGSAASGNPASQGDRVGKETLSTWLFRQEQKGTCDADLAVIVNSIAVACKKISNLVATAPIRGLVGLADSKNESGDEQKKLDVISNDIFVECMADTARSAVIVTEEEDVPVGVDALSGDYIVCFDPIDGSSNIDAAVPTGSIWGVYKPGDSCMVEESDDAETALEKCVVTARKSGEELACAGYVLYSSSTVMMLTVGDGVYGFTLDWTTGEFVLSHEDVKIPETTADAGRFYSGNQGNVDKWAPEMRAYARHLQQSAVDDDDAAPFSYRYIGALVGDFHRTLLYGGIWLYPPDSSAPEGKARLLYEVAPMGFMAEQAGGAATRGPLAKDRVVEVVPEHIHQRSPMFVGSKTMVGGLQAFLAEREA